MLTCCGEGYTFLDVLLMKYQGDSQYSSPDARISVLALGFRRELRTPACLGVDFSLFLRSAAPLQPLNGAYQTLRISPCPLVPIPGPESN
jgi:hypothetical protein